jgi:hypothetical protein
MINTNGLWLAQDSDFVDRIAQYRPTIYLQFDGLIPSTHRELRGHDLRGIKRRALDHLAEAGLDVVLVATVAQGVNEDEIGDIFYFGLEHPAVRGVCYQPVSYVGRCLVDVDPINRITVPGVLHALEDQTDGVFQVSDFRPVPCPYPTCSACTYAFVDGDQVIPVTRLLNVDDYLDLHTNRTLPDLSTELQPALEALWGAAAVIGSDRTTTDRTCGSCCDIPFSLGSAPLLRRESFFMVQVHGFMDAHNFDLKRLMKCCVHQLLPDGRAVPFCAYNNLGYREQVRHAQGVSQCTIN